MLIEQIRAQFLKDVSSHTIKVIQDDGLYRHLRFDDEGSSVFHFNLTTVPGYLFITGDMGSYTFQRLKDMFCFFRSYNGELSINPSYWSEKLESICRRNGIEKFSKEIFKETLLSLVDTYLEDLEEGEREVAKAEILEDLENSVFCHEEDDRSGDTMVSAARDFESRGMSFEDLWEHNFTEHTFHYLWCLYAIVWGIEKYDEYKQNEKD